MKIVDFAINVFFITALIIIITFSSSQIVHAQPCGCTSARMPRHDIGMCTKWHHPLQKHNDCMLSVTPRLAKACHGSYMCTKWHHPLQKHNGCLVSRLGLPRCAMGHTCIQHDTTHYPVANGSPCVHYTLR